MPNHPTTPIWPRLPICGVPIDDCSMDQALGLAWLWLVTGRARTVVTPNPEILLHASRHPNYRRLLSSADLALPDGFGLRLASRLHHTVPGVDFATELLKNIGPVRITALIRRDGRSTADAVQAAIEQLAPSAVVAVVASSQQWSRQAGDQLAEAVSHTDPQLVLVGLGFPFQEEWLLRYKDNLPTVNLLIALGGTFDFWTGVASRAPDSFRALHLEWLWRLLGEPRRVTRIFRAVIVFPMVAWRSRWHHHTH